MNTFNAGEIIKSADINANFTGLANGTEIQDGAITAPKLSNVYMFKAYRTANYGASSGGTVQLNATQFDLNSDFNTSTYTYTVPVTGYYQFNFKVMFTVTAGIGYYGALMLNGTQAIRGSGFIHGYTNGSYWGGSTGSGLLYLTAGDEMTVYWVGTNNNIAGGTAYTYLDGRLVVAE